MKTKVNSVNTTNLISCIKNLQIISEKDLKILMQKNEEDSYKTIEHLAAKFPESRDILGKAWGDELSTAYLNLKKTFFKDPCLKVITKDLALKYSVIPVYCIDNVLTVAMSNPKNNLIINELEQIIKKKINPVFSFKDEIECAINIQYADITAIDLSSKLLSQIGQEKVITEETLIKLAGSAYVIEFTNQIILQALKERASDIHIEPDENFVHIRFRIDGLLQNKLKFNKSFLLQIVSRLKILAGVDILEKRKPLDGKISFDLSTHPVDIRFSSIPTINGEKVVLRLLGILAFQGIPNLEDLYLSKQILEDFKRIIKMPNGMFFITGPTGSGKTTTLFSALKSINSPNINIMSIEDPVEYKLSGINQVQVNNKTGLTFSSAIRSFLRQDPDVILIGEVRDLETAKIASQAALTGHFVYATMHTNNSLQAITRLVEIGVEPFLVAPSVLAVMAQRLVRKLCDECKEKYILSEDERNELFYNYDNEQIEAYKPIGCKYCNNTGYKGRIALSELFIIDEELRSMIARNASILDINDYVNQKGFKSLWYDGIKKSLMGLTSLEEIRRVVLYDV